MPYLGARIKALREARMLSQAELARRIGIKPPSLSDIERGETRALKGTTLAALCDVLHTTADFLLSRQNDEADLEARMLEAEMVFIVRHLSPQRRQAVLDFGRYELSQQPATTGSPFARKTTKV